MGFYDVRLPPSYLSILEFLLLHPSPDKSLLFFTLHAYINVYYRNVNARSVFLGCKYAIAQFLSQEMPSSGHRGWIINTASMLGLVGFAPNAGAYCASKGAVVLLTKQIAVEYGKEKIHCNALCPSCKFPPPPLLSRSKLLLYLMEHECPRIVLLYRHSRRLSSKISDHAWSGTAGTAVADFDQDLKTPMTTAVYADEKFRNFVSDMTPWGDWGSAEDVAGCAVFLASNDAAYVTGLAMTIDGGYTAQ